MLTGERHNEVGDLLDLSSVVKELNKHNLAIVAGSELEDVARTQLASPKTKAMTSDEAVTKLIDGTLSWAVLGGVQAEYLTRRFSHSAVVLTYLDRPTAAHLWFMKRGLPEP